MVTNCRACIIHPLVIMMAKMNRTSTFFKVNSETQVGSTTKTLRHEEWHHIMLYLLTNLDEVIPYIQQFLDELWRRSTDPARQEYDTLVRQELYALTPKADASKQM